MKTDPRSSRLLIVSERAYRALLVLYPAEFRDEYGKHMAQVFRDSCRDVYRHGGAEALLQWWLAALLDLVLTVISERRKVNLTMSQSKFIHWSGWFCIFGGIFFAASSLSQLLQSPGMRSDSLYRLSLLAFVPGMTFIALGLLGIFLRYKAQLHLFGTLSLLTALIGACITAVGWLLTLAGSDNFWNVFMLGWLLYLAGHSVFGGFATTTHLLPKWNFALLIGSALPLTVLVLFGQQVTSGANWPQFAMLLLIGIGWLMAGAALNSQTAQSTQAAATV
jgi:hypothetical protein